MRAVKDRDSEAEMTVRRILHSMGYRYRLHRTDLPGKPDIVLPGRQKIIFIHGCFWHGHKCKRGNRIPKANRDYWLKKIARNQKRDRAAKSALATLGWKVATLWECKLADREALIRELQRFLKK